MATQAQGIQLANSMIGKKYDFDGAYGAQCFDLINQYAYELAKTSFPGAGAIDLLQTGNRNGFKVIKDANGIYPEAGDIFIMQIYSHQWGHTGIVLATDKVGMTVIDQNFDGNANTPATKRYIKYTESWGKIVGWIRPPWTSSTATSSNTAASSTGSRVTKTGTFTLTVDSINVRNSPSTKGEVAATYKKGQKVNYDSYVIADGHVWISYVSESGVRRYMAIGPNDNNAKNVWGTGF